MTTINDFSSQISTFVSRLLLWIFCWEHTMLWLTLGPSVLAEVHSACDHHAGSSKPLASLGLTMLPRYAGAIGS